MALSTQQLDSMLKQEPMTKRYFIGVFPSCFINQVSLPRRNHCFITNTDNHESSGEHWNAWFVRDGILYFSIHLDVLLWMRHCPIVIEILY